MNKSEYQKAYRVARLLLQCRHYPDRRDRVGKKALHQQMKEITSDPILQMWIPTNAIQKNYKMETAFHQFKRMRHYDYPLRSREWLHSIDIRNFKLLLNDVYGAVKREVFKKN